MQQVSFRFRQHDNGQKPYALIPISWDNVNRKQMVQSWFPTLHNYHYGVAWTGYDMNDLMKRAHVTHDNVKKIWYRESNHAIVAYVFCHKCPIRNRANKLYHVYWFDVGLRHDFISQFESYRVQVHPLENVKWGPFVQQTWKRDENTRVFTIRVLSQIDTLQKKVFCIAVLFILAATHDK